MTRRINDRGASDSKRNKKSSSTNIHEKIKLDILPKSGAGQDGTDTLVKSYMKDTPGQSYKKFKDYIK